MIKSALNPHPRDPIFKWFDDEGPIIRAKGTVEGDCVVFRFRGIMFFIHNELVQEVEE